MVFRKQEQERTIIKSETDRFDSEYGMVLSKEAERKEKSKGKEREEEKSVKRGEEDMNRREKNNTSLQYKKNYNNKLNKIKIQKGKPDIYQRKSFTQNPNIVYRKKN